MEKFGKKEGRIGSLRAFDPYRNQLSAAAEFARSNDLGVWSACGGFGISAVSLLVVPTAVPAMDEI
jgi:hypothetical protein